MILFKKKDLFYVALLIITFLVLYFVDLYLVQSYYYPSSDQIDKLIEKAEQGDEKAVQQLKHYYMNTKNNESKKDGF
jgi:hypothetical protein